MTAKMKTNRPPTRPRFPQGSEVWSTGCPKFGTAETSELTNPKLEGETGGAPLRRGGRVAPSLGGSVALISLLMLGPGRRLVPGRLQSVAEIAYEFVANTVRSTAGKDGMKFFPLVFSLFMLIAVSNIVGVIPYNFKIESHIIVTAALGFLGFFP